MVDSLEEIEVLAIRFSKFEMLDAMVASALNTIIQNSQFKKKKSVSRNRESKKEDRFLRRRQIAFIIDDDFRVTGAHDTVLDYAGFISITLRNDDVQEFDTRWDEVLLSMSKIPPDDVLESLCKLRIGEAERLKTVLEVYDMEIHLKLSMPNNQISKTMVKRSMDQKLPLRSFDARNEKLKQEQWSRVAGH